MLKYIDNLRNSILESFQDISYDGYVNNKISKDKINKAMSLVRSFVAESCGDNEMETEADRYVTILERYIKEYTLFNNVKLYEGFYNPFDDGDDDNEINLKPVETRNEDKSIKIKKVKLWDTNIMDKVYYDKGKLRAGRFFGKGDTIEVSPIRLIKREDLYSKTIRDIAFTIDSEKNMYAIPFGYASFYRNSKETSINHNADYELINPNDYDLEALPYHPTIRIYATTNIKKGTEIILFADDSDFENELRPDQFNYTPEKTEPYLSIKNFKII